MLFAALTRWTTRKACSEGFRSPYAASCSCRWNPASLPWYRVEVAVDSRITHEVLAAVEVGTDGVVVRGLAALGAQA